MKKHLAPYQDEIQALIQTFITNMQAKQREFAKTKKGDELEKALFEEAKTSASGILGKLKAIRTRAAAEKVPAELQAKLQEFLSGLDGQIAGVEQMTKQSWEDVQKMKANRGAR